METILTGHRYCAEELRNAFRLFSIGFSGERIRVVDVPQLLRCTGLTVTVTEVEEQLATYRNSELDGHMVTWAECRRLIEYFGLPQDSEEEAEYVFRLAVLGSPGHRDAESAAAADSEAGEEAAGSAPIMLPKHVSKLLRSGAPFRNGSSAEASPNEALEASAVALCRQMDIDHDGVVTLPDWVDFLKAHHQIR